jgi:hypothetical protein
VMVLGRSRKLDGGQGDQCRTSNRENCLFHCSSPLSSRSTEPGALCFAVLGR